MENLAIKLLFLREMRETLADEQEQPHPGQRQPNPEGAQQNRCRDHLSRSLEQIPSIKYMMTELNANPLLLFGDVRAYRAHVQKKGHCFKDPDLPKCSVRAAELRRFGNQLYAKRQYADALKKYNESICSAPNGSEDLGIGYANRSAIFYEQRDFKLTLANIALARKHNYPRQLMPKLMTRETNCHVKLDEINRTGCAYKYPTLAFNLEPNPTIPFLSKGISARKHPIYGDSMVAERNFKAGDVILQEKPMQVSVSFQHKFTNCNRCLSENMLHLIPCPNCTAAMFCNEVCLQEGQKIHRFECGLTAELSQLNDFWMGPRMFFRGLTLFDDDVKKMMVFCQANKQTGGTFFNLNYSNYNPLEEFKQFLTATPRSAPRPLFDNVLQFNAAIFYVMYMKNPLVRSLITGQAQKDFMLQCFLEFMTQANSLSIQQDANGQLYPVASVFGHSCDPNTLLLDYAGQLKLIVLRPIRHGDLVLISYGPMYDQEPADRRIRLNALGFECPCDFCDEQKRQEWLAKAKQASSIAPAHLATVRRVMVDMGLHNADKLNGLQQFVQRYASTHPQEDFASILQAYCFVLTVSYQNEMKAVMRNKIAG